MSRNLNTYRASRRIGWAGSVRQNGKPIDWRQFTINGSAKSSEPVLTLTKRKLSQSSQKIVNGLVS